MYVRVPSLRICAYDRGFNSFSGAAVPCRGIRRGRLTSGYSQTLSYGRYHMENNIQLQAGVAAVQLICGA